MPAGALILYNGMSEYLGDGTVDLDNDTFVITLHTSAYTPAGTHDTPADLTNEVANANGYTTGGQALANVTWTRSGAVTTFDSDDAIWTASGGSITARYAVLRDTTAGKLVGYVLLDDTPADLVATDGNPFRVAPNATFGWYQQTVNA